MPDIQALKDKYFIQPEDVPASATAPAIHDGCRVTPLVDPAAYFNALEAELALLGTDANPEANTDQFIFIVGWWLDLLGNRQRDGQAVSRPFSLDGPNGPQLVDVLKEKASRGVDVRVLVDMGWTIMRMYELFQKHPKIRKKLGLTDEKVENIVPFVDRYEDSMDAVEDLRRAGVKCCFNVICHAAGGTHMKFVLLGARPNPAEDFRAVGFTGGVDFRFDRYDHVGHQLPRPYNGLQLVGWHDVVAKVEGPVLQAFYQDFQLMWNEVLARPVKTYRAPYIDPATNTLTYRKSRSVEPNSDPVTTRTLSSEVIGVHSLQSLRTAPAANYNGLWGRVAQHWGSKPLSFAPEGLFNIEMGWQKAIAAAKRYIYMEDWAYWSQDVMVWINDRIKVQPHLNVVLVQGRNDPNDTEYPPFMIFALWKLILGLTSEQKQRIRVFRRSDVLVHAKTTVIDDEWAIIGSTVCCRRSLSTDFEHSVVMLDRDDQLVRNYRKALWSDHFSQPSPTDLEAALDMWFGNAGMTLPSNLVLFPLEPTPKLTITDAQGNIVNIPEEQIPDFMSSYNDLASKFWDVDSRKPWGDFSIKSL